MVSPGSELRLSCSRRLRGEGPECTTYGFGETQRQGLTQGWCACRHVEEELEEEASGLQLHRL